MQILQAEAQEVAKMAVAPATRRLYDCLLAGYIDGIQKIPGFGEPFPITDEKVRAYLMFRKNYERCTHGTLKADLASIRRYLAEHFIFDFTRTVQFRDFLNGLKRQMAEGVPPNRKLPITGDLLTRMAQQIDDEDAQDVEDMAIMSLGYFGFLRLSEIVGLRTEDVQLTKDRIRLHIRRSKTDQGGNGVECYILRTNRPYDAVFWMHLFSCQKDLSVSQPLFDSGCRNIRARIRVWLGRIGIPEESLKKYSTHSLRRGGAAAAARAGVEDSVIQRHGRWKTWCFTVYTQMEREDAGRIITARI